MWVFKVVELYRALEPAVGVEGLAPAIGLACVQIALLGRVCRGARGGEVAEDEAAPELGLGGQRVEGVRHETDTVRNAFGVHKRKHVYPRLPRKLSELASNSRPTHKNEGQTSGGR